MKLKVVFIDDEYLVRERLKHIIDWDAEGFEISGEAEDGEQGLRLIKDIRPDLAIIDINMPRLNGLDMSEIIRKESIQIKIAILSGYDDFVYAKRAIRTGISVYLLKPINKLELLEFLKETREQYAEKVLYSKTVLKVLQYIEFNYADKNLSTSLIADHVGINQTYLSTKFKKETGKNLVDTINIYRLRQAEVILMNQRLNLQELADRVGFHDPYYMSRCFKKYLGGCRIKSENMVY